jgi:hypothetical protein
VTAFERVLDAVREYGLAVTEQGGERAIFQAPGHSDRDRSVSVRREADAVLLKCHSDLTTAEVLDYIGLTMSDLFDTPRRSGSPRSQRDVPKLTPEQIAERDERRRKRAELDAAHNEAFERELQLAEEIAAGENPDAPRPDWSDPLVQHPELRCESEIGDHHEVENLQSAGCGADDQFVQANGDSSATSTSPSGSKSPPAVSGRTILDEVREHFARYVSTVDDSDLDLVTMWSAHTHLVTETYTTPRLLIDSPVPGSGKTTLLEHLERLCAHPIQMASVSSSAMLARMLDQGMRTMLIDEADRSLDPKKPGVEDLLAILNSGYKRGGTRPVLVPGKNGAWDVQEMATYSPVALAGNSPNLPDDTRSRCIRVLLLPDLEGRVEESDWELVDEPARRLGSALAAWGEIVAEQVRTERPPLPDEVRGRARERWLPLKRIAVAAGGRWPAVVDDLAIRDIARINDEREEGLTVEKRHVLLLRHIGKEWQPDEAFIPTDDLLARLVAAYPDLWGTGSQFKKALTPQGLGRMLTKNYNIHSSRRPDGDRARGYVLDSFRPAFRGFGIEPGR